MKPPPHSSFINLGMHQPTDNNTTNNEYNKWQKVQNRRASSIVANPTNYVV